MRNRTGASRLTGAGRWDVRLVDAQEKSATTGSVAGGGDLLEQRTLNFIRCAARNDRGYRPIRGEAAGDADHGANVVGGWPLPTFAERLRRHQPIIRHVPLETSRSGACGPIAARTADLLGAEKSENRASLHVRTHEGVGVLLRLLRRLFVMLEVMSEVVHRLLEWHIEGVGRARKNNDFQIRLALGCLA